VILLRHSLGVFCPSPSTKDLPRKPRRAALHFWYFPAQRQPILRDLSYFRRFGSPPGSSVHVIALFVTPLFGGDFNRPSRSLQHVPE
jgi:hypothetical protein